MSFMDINHDLEKWEEIEKIEDFEESIKASIELSGLEVDRWIRQMNNRIYINQIEELLSDY